MDEIISLPFEKFTLKDEFFEHFSTIHGKNHVYRVMFHTLNLGREFGDEYITKLAFCAAFIHDMNRTHDGYCTLHGHEAALKTLPKFEELFLSIGVDEDNIDAISYAVAMHSMPDAEYYPLGEYGDTMRLLKDADGLDRVRLADLDPSYLRFDFTKKYIDFANEFYFKIEDADVQNFMQVIDIAEKLLGNIKIF